MGFSPAANFSPKAYTYLCGAFAALGSTLFGYDLGIIASVITAPNFLEVTGLEVPAVKNAQSASIEAYTGFIVSSLQLGGFVGCIPASLVADRFSRRAAITLGATTFLLGGALQTGAQSKEMMLAGRFFAGMAIGQLSLLAPLYQSEIAHPSIRGSMLSYQQFFLGWGGLIATWIGFACSQSHLHGTPAQWRMPLGLQILPAIPLVFLTFMLPESPRWLLIKGREEESLNTLARLHARGDANDAFVRGEFEEMKAKLRVEAESQATWGQLFADRSNIRKLMLGITLQFSVQFTGVSVLQYYAPRVYDAIGFSTTKALLIQACNNIGAQVAETLCVIFADRMGRRWPMIICNIFSGISFSVGTANQRSYSNGHGTKGIGYCFVAMTYIFNFFFSLAIGPLSWAYPVEIFNTGIRAKAIMITSMASWLANFMFGEMAPTVFAQIGWRFYIVFAVCSFTNAVTIWLFFPETKGRTLEEMDQYFHDTPIIVAFAKVKTISRTERERELREGVGHYRVDEKNLPEEAAGVQTATIV